MMGLASGRADNLNSTLDNPGGAHEASRSKSGAAIGGSFLTSPSLERGANSMPEAGDSVPSFNPIPSRATIRGSEFDEHGDPA
jgi:hypothetical protein